MGVTRRSGATGGGCLATLPLAVLLVPPPSSSSTPSTTLVPILPTTPRTPSPAVTVSSTASSTSTGRPSPLTVLPVSTVVSCLPSPASSSTVVSTSVSTTPSSRSSSLARSRATSLHLSSSAGLSPPLPVLPLTRSTTSFVVLPALVSCPSTTRSSSSCSARPSRVALKRPVPRDNQTIPRLAFICKKMEA